jgi:spermidine synthase
MAAASHFMVHACILLRGRIGMKPWVLLESVAIPGGSELSLYQHVNDFAIRVGREELMNSMSHGSEDALARLAFARVSTRPPRQVLIGGLGMGFTVAAALRDAAPDDGIVVAELMPAVVTWNRGPLASLAGNPLSDPRVKIHAGDVAELLRSQPNVFDLILLDVDNGPQALTTPANHWLYGTMGLAKAYAALRPGGVLAVWSAGPDAAFTRRLHHAGFQVSTEQARAHGKRGARFIIWLGIKPKHTSN